MPDIFLYVRMGPKHLDIFFSYRSRALFGIYPTQSIQFIYLCIIVYLCQYVYNHVSMVTPTDLPVYMVYVL